LVREVSGYEYGSDPTAVRELENVALHAAGTAKALRIEHLLLGGLASARTSAARDTFCRDLALVGGDTAIPALARLLADPATSDMARYSIESIGGARAAEALRAALSRSSPPVRIGIVVSLGRLHDNASVTAIRHLLTSRDAMEAAAAARALARIASPVARQALLTAAPSPAVADALLQVALQSPAADAAGIYRRLSAPEQGVSVRVAALRGLVGIDAGQAKPLLHSALKSGPPPLQAAAVRELARLEGVALAEEMPHATELLRVQILAALSDSGRPEVRSVLLANVASASEAVRVTALTGLARLGTAADVAMLAERAAATHGDEQAAARLALAGIRDAAADGAILRSLPSAEAKTKVELIRAIGARGIPSASTVLLEAAGDPNRTVRLESIRALRQTAGLPQVPALLEHLGKTSAETERRELERTTAAAIRRSPGSPVGDVIRAYAGAGDTDTRASLLNLLSAVGSADGLPLLREALQDPNPDIQLAALRALSAWPTPAPMPDLLALARSAQEPARRVLALRGYVQLVQIPSNRTPAETAGLLESAMALAMRPEEKRAILSAVQKVVCPEALRLARSALNDPAVAAEARLAATTLEHALAYLKQ
jgi:HEAT repeat protein